jgi:hypothetical protein
VLRGLANNWPLLLSKVWSRSNSALTLHSPCTPYARTMHAHAMHSLCTPSALTMHSLCTHSALTMHSPCTHHALPMHSLRCGHDPTKHALCTHHALTMHAPCTPYALTKVWSRSNLTQQYVLYSLHASLHIGVVTIQPHEEVWRHAIHHGASAVLESLWPARQEADAVAGSV